MAKQYYAIIVCDETRGGDPDLSGLRALRADMKLDLPAGMTVEHVTVLTDKEVNKLQAGVEI